MQSKQRASSMEKGKSQEQEHRAKMKHLNSFSPIAASLPKKNIIVLGVCAKKKKVESKPMKQILSRLDCPEIQIVLMWECLEHCWTTWPVVDALICFYSDGFPYLMAWRYVQKYKPFLINNLQKQQLLWDRTVIYDILEKLRVPVAKHYYVYRDEKHLQKIEKKAFGSIVQPQLESMQYLPLVERVSSMRKQSTTEKKVTQISPMTTEKWTPDKIIPEIISPIEKGPKQRLYQHEATKPTSTTEIQAPEEKLNTSDIQLSSNNELSSAMTTTNDKLNLTDISSPVEKVVQLQRQSSNKSEFSYPRLLRDYYAANILKRTNYAVEQSQEDDCIFLKKGDTKIKMKKPFVEKPFESQNHQICIYYPSEMGGGRKKLFRKIKNTSSQYKSEENCIRHDGNYIYEQYLPTNGFDIKVYTIGPYYMYAEARKAPTLDGVVVRNKEGKEKRFPVILTPEEKYICNRIVEQFEQDICGFDLLRCNGKSYVCDVNGWSFVKSNPKYWEDCSTILKKKMFNHFFPTRIQQMTPLNKVRQAENEFRPPIDQPLPKVEELRSIVSIFRHADRSPKMKIKIKTQDKRFIALFDGAKKNQIKFKDPKNLTNFLNLIIEKIAELDHTDPLMKQFMQIKLILQSGGHFEGLTRKLQLKVVDRQQMEDGSKGQITKIVIILKWGGQLTYLGYEDAIELGKKMREERYDDNDCLSLYSSYRHDLKTYASDEGRCIKTAAAFLKGFLSSSGQLAPIISSMVQADAKAQRLLDCTSEQNHSNLGDKVCRRLNEIMNRDKDIIDSYLEYTKIENLSDNMIQTLKEIGNPRVKLGLLNKCIHDLVKQIERIYMEQEDQDDAPSRKSNAMPTQECENIMLVNSRWSKLKKDFYNKETKQFNISKIPQIYDTVRHDYHKNGDLFDDIDPKIKQTLYKESKLLAHFVVPNEYGINDEERVQVAVDICLPLLEKILVDLMFWKEMTEQYGYWKYKNPTQGQDWRHIRSRLYFTSASHMYSLLNILTRGNNRQLLKKSPEEEAKKVFNILYMSYLSHIELRLYENLRSDTQDPNRFRLQVSISTRFHKNEELKQYSLGGKGFTINEIQSFINSFVEQRRKKQKSRSKEKVSSSKNKSKPK